MAGRRRQRRTDASKIDATPPWETRVREDPRATTGPYDERDAPEDDVERVDLGALRIPVDEQIEVRVDLNEAKQVIAATLDAARPFARDLGSEDAFDGIDRILAEGNGADRQRAAFARGGMAAALELLVTESEEPYE